MKTIAELAIIYSVQSELDSARKKFKKFNSTHEGYAVIKEELDELWKEVKRKKKNKKKMEREALQVSAMAIRFILDLLIDKEKR